MRYFIYLGLLFLGVAPLFGQTQIDWNTQIKNKPTGFPPLGPCGGDLSGNFPNCTIPGNLHYFSVLDNGADKTGAADATAAFNTTVTAAVNAGGGVVYMPCGNYLLNGTVTINSHNVGFSGENQHCVNLNYSSTGTALVIQGIPFSTDPYGIYENFNIIGTSSGAIGIQTGCIVGASFRNIAVDGFSNGTGIDLQDRLDCFPSGGGAWTERNSFINVWGGGLNHGNNSIGWKLELIGAPTNKSFGYNRFLGVYANVSPGQIGFQFGPGVFMYNIPDWFSTCNMDDGSVFTSAPVCMDVSGVLIENHYHITGEYNGTHSAVSVQTHAGASFSGWGLMNVLDQTGNPIAGICNGGTCTSQFPIGRITAIPEGQTFDTGLMTLSGVSTTPSIFINDRNGIFNFGTALGNNINSPFLSMFNAAGNQFLICALGLNDSITTCPTKAVAYIDAAGNEYLKNQFFNGGVTAATSNGNFMVETGGRAYIHGDTVPAAGFPNLPVVVGGRTNATWTGQASIFTSGLSPSYNETWKMGDNNGTAGIGVFLDINKAHTFAYAFNGDTSDFSVHERDAVTGVSSATKVWEILHGGHLSGIGHIDQDTTAPHNIAGTCAVAGATSCIFTYTTTFNSKPVCVASPEFQVAAAATGRWFVTPAATQCTITFEAAQTGTIDFIVIGNPN